MHILIIPSWYPSHDDDINGTFFREQARALAKLGNQVGVIATILEHPNQFTFRKFLFGSKVEYRDEMGFPVTLNRRIAGTRFVPYMDIWQSVRSTLRLFADYCKRNGRPDIIHVHAMNYSLFAAAKIKEKYGIPFVVTEHSSAFARRRIVSWQHKAIRKALNSSDGNFAVSQPFAQLLEHDYGLGNWGEMPNILSPVFIDTPPSKPAESNNFVFLNISNLTPNKRVKNLIEATKIVVDRGFDVTLKIAGTGGQEQQLKALCDGLGLENRVLFLGALSPVQIVRELDRGKCLVISSFYETFGVVAIEAHARGRPVIATKCGGPNHIVNRSNGKLIEIDDVPILAEAMIEMIGNYGQFSPMNIRENTIGIYSGENVMRNYFKYYQSIINMN